MPFLFSVLSCIQQIYAKTNGSKNKWETVFILFCFFFLIFLGFGKRHDSHGFSHDPNRSQLTEKWGDREMKTYFGYEQIVNSNKILPEK